MNWSVKSHRMNTIWEQFMTFTKILLGALENTISNTIYKRHEPESAEYSSKTQGFTNEHNTRTLRYDEVKQQPAPPQKLGLGCTDTYWLNIVTGSERANITFLSRYPVANLPISGLNNDTGRGPTKGFLDCQSTARCPNHNTLNNHQDIFNLLGAPSSCLLLPHGCAASVDTEFLYIQFSHRNTANPFTTFSHIYSGCYYT